MITKTTSFRLSEEVLNEIKHKAWLEDTSQTKIIEKAIRSYIATPKYPFNVQTNTENSEGE